MVATKWNDPNFAPTKSVKDLHSDFALPIPIPFDTFEKLLPATPEKVEEKWNSMNLALKQAITNWERSSQGDGGYIDSNDDDDGTPNDDDVDDDDANDDVVKEFGALAGRSQGALDLRRNFFDDRNTYLLYLWDILDEHDLVQSTMQQLLEGAASGNGTTGVPSVIGSNNKHPKYDDVSLSKRAIELMMHHSCN